MAANFLAVATMAGPDPDLAFFFLMYSPKGLLAFHRPLAASLSACPARQYLPDGRTAELLGNLCGLPIPQGTIINILKSFTAKSAPAYGLIARKERDAKAVGADETGIRVDGNKGRYRAWQRGSATYIVFSDNRGIATIDANFPSGIPGAVLVHDRWASHFRTACRTRQLAPRTCCTNWCISPNATLRDGRWSLGNRSTAA